MQQRSFGSVEYEHTKVKTRRQRFLERMEGLAPWDELAQRIAPVYPKPGRGRRPYPLRVLLRIHCLQLWFNLSDPAMEDLLYEAESARRFGYATVRYRGLAKNRERLALLLGLGNLLRAAPQLA